MYSFIVNKYGNFPASCNQEVPKPNTELPLNRHETKVVAKVIQDIDIRLDSHNQANLTFAFPSLFHESPQLQREAEIYDMASLQWTHQGQGFVRAYNAVSLLIEPHDIFLRGACICNERDGLTLVFTVMIFKQTSRGSPWHAIFPYSSNRIEPKLPDQQPRWNSTGSYIKKSNPTWPGILTLGMMKYMS